jgi:hypothetical protein
MTSQCHKPSFVTRCAEVTFRDWRYRPVPSPRHSKPPSTPTAPQEHFRKSWVDRLSIMSPHFLQRAALAAMY